MNTMKRLKSKYDAVNKAMGIGRTTKKKLTPENFGQEFEKLGDTESKSAKAWRTSREALEKLERAVHAATTPQGLKAAIKAMGVAQTAFNKVYKAHEKGTRR